MITNSETSWSEATIVINGYQLTFAESMSVRVAVSSFRMSLNANRKELGLIADGYDFHLTAVEQKLIGKDL
jgi:hypothetical protein